MEIIYEEGIKEEGKKQVVTKDGGFSFIKTIGGQRKILPFIWIELTGDCASDEDYLFKFAHKFGFTYPYEVATAVIDTYNS